MTQTHEGTGRLVVGRYLTTYMLDRAGDGLFYVALGWLATRASGDLGTAAILAAGSVPRVAMLLFGGALGDRWGLIRTARGTLVARILLMLVFAAAALPEHPSGLLLALTAAAFGLVDALHTPALTGLSGVLLRGPAVVRAQGAMGGIGNTVEVVAGPLAGALIAWRADSVGWLGALLAAAALLALPRPSEGGTETDRSEAAPRSVLHDVADVLRTALRSASLRTMLGVFAVANFAATPAVMAGVPLLAVDRGWNAQEYGIVMAGFALGSVAGAALLAWIGHRITHPARISALSLLPGAVAIAAVGMSADHRLATVAVSVAGATFALGAGALMGTIKSHTPPQEMGRMMSLVHVSVYSLIPAGLVTYGAIAAAASAQTAQVVMALVMGAGSALALTVGPLRNLTTMNDD